MSSTSAFLCRKCNGKGVVKVPYKWLKTGGSTVQTASYDGLCKLCMGSGKHDDIRAELAHRAAERMLEIFGYNAIQLPTSSLSVQPLRMNRSLLLRR